MTLTELARQLGMQPHELAAYANLGYVPDDHRLDPEMIQIIKESIARNPDPRARDGRR